jgi:hypothetical protein
MNIIYKVTYLPHLKNETPPYYYVGSKYDYNGNYFGSLSSKQEEWYTEGLTICDWWRKQVKENKDNFLFEVIFQYDEITPVQLVEEEKRYQLELDVKNSQEYFNKSIATTGWVSASRTDESKEKIRKITKEYWDAGSEESIKRREELSERNRKVKSKEMKEKWKNSTDKMIKNRERFIHMAKTQKIIPKYTSRKVFCRGVIYESAVEASKVFGVTPDRIRQKCRLEKYEDFYYIN